LKQKKENLLYLALGFIENDREHYIFSPWKYLKSLNLLFLRNKNSVTASSAIEDLQFSAKNTMIFPSHMNQHTDGPDSEKP